MKIDPKIFLEGVRTSQLFRVSFYNRSTSIGLVVLIRQTSSAKLEQSLCSCQIHSFLGTRPVHRHVSPLVFINETFSSKNICLSVTMVKYPTIEALFSILMHQIRIWSVQLILGFQLNCPHNFVFLNLNKQNISAFALKSRHKIMH